MPIKAGSKIRYIPDGRKGVVKDEPNPYVYWVQVDGDPPNREHGWNKNYVEELMEEHVGICNSCNLQATLNRYKICTECNAAALTLNNNVGTMLLPTGSIKKDDNKYDPTMLTIEMVELVSRVRMFGAKKYARGNFKITGFKYTRSLAAAMRHILAFLNGEDNDPESGLSHLGHAICSIEHCIYDTKNHPENDDRKS